MIEVRNRISQWEPILCWVKVGTYAFFVGISHSFWLKGIPVWFNKTRNIVIILFQQITFGVRSNQIWRCSCRFLNGCCARDFTWWYFKVSLFGEISCCHTQTRKRNEILAKSWFINEMVLNEQNFNLKLSFRPESYLVVEAIRFMVVCNRDGVFGVMPTLLGVGTAFRALFKSSFDSW